MSKTRKRQLCWWYGCCVSLPDAASMSSLTQTKYGGPTGSYNSEIVCEREIHPRQGVVALRLCFWLGSGRSGRAFAVQKSGVYACALVGSGCADHGAERICRGHSTRMHSMHTACVKRGQPPLRTNLRLVTLRHYLTDTQRIALLWGERGRGGQARGYNEHRSY